jgi:ribosomal protein L13E
VRAPGYSRLELERAGLTQADAERMGIPVDTERRSMIGSNVIQLRLLACA